MTIVELEQEVGISHGSIHAITSDLKLRRVGAKFVLKQLTTDQMECRMMVAEDHFEKSTQDLTFLTKTVTGDLAPSDFWLFPTLKMGLKWTRFATMEHIKSNATAKLQRIPKAFHRCLQQWQD
jgi:hypothetical protein